MEMANPGWRDGAAKPAGRRPQDLPGAGSCQPQPEGTSLGSQDGAGSANASTFPWPCLELRGMGSTQGAAASHHGQGSQTQGRAAVMLPPHAQPGREGHVSGIIKCVRVWIWELHGKKRHEV